jgi:hypothetical protein
MSESEQVVSDDEAFYASVLAEIEAGLAKARAQGIVCGPPMNLRIERMPLPLPPQENE